MASRSSTATIACSSGLTSFSAFLPRFDLATARGCIGTGATGAFDLLVSSVVPQCGNKNIDEQTIKHFVLQGNNTHLYMATHQRMVSLGDISSHNTAKTTFSRKKLTKNMSDGRNLRYS